MKTPGADVDTIFPAATLVGSAAMPPGKFLVTAKVEVQGHSRIVDGFMVPPTIGCFLEAAGTTTEELDRVFAGDDATLEGPMVMTGAIDFSGAGVLSVSCFQRTSLATVVAVRNTTFVALKVSELEDR